MGNRECWLYRVISFTVRLETKHDRSPVDHVSYRFMLKIVLTRDYKTRKPFVFLTNKKQNFEISKIKRRKFSRLLIKQRNTSK